MNSRHRLPAAAALVAVIVSAAPGAAAAAPPSGEPAPLGYTTYGSPIEVCRPTDRRLDSVSGIAVTSDGTYVQNDRDGTLWQLDQACRPVRQLPVPADVGRLVDTEDLAFADGSLWIADTGGNRVQRTVVSLIQVTASPSQVHRYALVYPDGPHDADAVLISPDGSQVLIVTKSGTVLAADAPLRTTAPTPLLVITQIRMSALAGRNPGPGAILVTGGAVSPDGLHLVLRTYNEAWEWDAADGRLADAFGGLPRKVTMPPMKQGEAITYTPDGQAFLVSGEQLAPVYRVTIDRPRYARTESAGTSGATTHDRGMIGAVLAAGAVGCLLLLVGAVVAERRRSRRRSALAADSQHARALQREPN